jgi:hypothetical protein
VARCGLTSRHIGQLIGVAGHSREIQCVTIAFNAVIWIGACARTIQRVVGGINAHCVDVHGVCCPIQNVVSAGLYPAERIADGDLRSLIVKPVRDPAAVSVQATMFERSNF